MLAIDYIFDRIHPVPEQTCFKFWMAPATLVFENVHDLRAELEPSLGVELQGVERTSPQNPKNVDYIDRDVEGDWKLALHSGEISFRSVGYKQYIREEPILSQPQVLDTEARGGISFYRGRIS